MLEPSHLKLIVLANQFDVSLLPLGARQPGTAAFCESVTAFLQREFERFGGSASIRVENDTIEVDWTTGRQPAEALAQIVDELKRGKYAGAITLLRLFSSALPNDANILYNLGTALSDTGKLHEAIEQLRRAVTIAPDFTNARVALGIALGRQGENEDALRVLDDAVARDPQNAWARRNLGAALLNAGKNKEAEECLREATVLDPTDQLAMFGLAEALANLGRFHEADDSYKKSIAIDPHSQTGAAARDQRRKIASRRAPK